jgi:hypothetical protein
MKRWIVRVLWLVAWCGWVWLGVGLHRELPREWGTPVVQLDVDEDDQTLGIVGSDAVVTQRKHGLRGATYKTWRVDDGSLVRTVEGPAHQESDLLRFGLSAGLHPQAGGDNLQRKPVQCLDLLTGEWTPLGSAFMEVLAVHRDRPWIALKEESDEGRTASVRVFDAERREFPWTTSIGAPSAGGAEHAVDAWFRDDVLEILWGRKAPPEKGSGRSFRIERWNVPEQKLLSTTPIEGRRPWIHENGSKDRFVMRSGNNGETVNVVDAQNLKTKFSAKDDYGRRSEWHTLDQGHGPAVLDEDARRLLTPVGVLWNVRSGQRLWRRDPKFEAVLRRELPDGRFSVLEDWKVWCERFGVTTEWTTVAVRSMETGGVDFRVWDWPFGPECVSDDWTLAVDVMGEIHHMPPPPNWRLLTICQSVVAAPFILLWIALRWRRRRSPVALRL